MEWRRRARYFVFLGVIVVGFGLLWGLALSLYLHSRSWPTEVLYIGVMWLSIWSLVGLDKRLSKKRQPSQPEQTQADRSDRSRPPTGEG